MKVHLSKVLSRYPSLKQKAYVALRYLILPWDPIERNIPAKGKIIDVGSGFGLYPIAFALGSKQRKVYGYELEAKRVASANKAAKGLNARFRTRDLRSDASVSSCDAITIIDVLHHLPKKTQLSLLRSCKRALKKGGILLVKDIDTTPKMKFRYNCFHDEIVMRQKVYPISSKDATDILKKLGFAVRREPLHLPVINPFPHYLLIATRP